MCNASSARVGCACKTRFARANSDRLGCFPCMYVPFYSFVRFLNRVLALFQDSKHSKWDQPGCHPTTGRHDDTHNKPQHSRLPRASDASTKLPNRDVISRNAPARYCVDLCHFRPRQFDVTASSATCAVGGFRSAGAQLHGS